MGKQPRVQPLLTVVGQSHTNAVFGIDVQYANRRPSNSGDTDDLASVPREMVRPLLVTWVEKLDNLSRVGVDPGQVRTLVQIAIDAGEREVCEIVTATVLSRQNVFDLEFGDGGLRLGQLAIFTAMASPLPDMLPRLLVHYEASRRRAFA
jgi:hypothetical protein